VLLDAARENGFKAVVTSLGGGALTLVQEHPISAITLDIYLPDMEGWRVLERLKNDLSTRHIPVCVISTDEARERGLNAGALAFLAKPIERRETIDELFREVKSYAAGPAQLVVVEPDRAKRDHILAAVQPVGLPVTAADDAGGVALRDEHIGCVVLGPGLDDEQRLAVAKEARSAGRLILPPLIVYAGEAVHDDAGWRRLGPVGAVRRVHSPERLLDEALFFLHRKVADLPEVARCTLEGLHRSDRILAGKTVLIVDDDMRNIFALSSVLEEHGMEIVAADNGRDAITTLRSRHDIDIVLMDIMMPEMDGIDTMREVRKIPQLNSLPIIAVTAKAMKGDR
jgi:CheY-like chemotaxis protein